MLLDNYSFFVGPLTNTRAFLEKEIPKVHPKSPVYIEYWKEQRRRCIEGHWVSGRWMPGKLYFYVNFATILISKKGSQVKTFARPWLRDLEWMFFLTMEEARGFSGFHEDEEYSCNRLLLDEGLTDEQLIEGCYDEEGNLLETLKNNLFKVQKGKDVRKTYVDARTYLRTIHDKNMGSPLYWNSAKNVMMLGSRGLGKSYLVSGLIGHEFLFDGKNSAFNPKDTKAEILVGAFDSKYSSDLLSKTRQMFKYLPGEYETIDRLGRSKVFAAPFAKNYRGSWDKEIVAQYSKKVGGKWKNDFGSGSSIKNRTFRDNPFNAQGTRPGLMLWEECFSPDTKVRKSNGDVVLINTLRVGDKLLTENGITTVKDKWEGTSDMYKIIPKYGESYVVTAKHLLYLKPTPWYATQTNKKFIKVSVENYIEWPEYKKRYWQVVTSTSVDYDKKEHAIDPYILGLWLGDGDSRNATIYNSDKSILSYLRSFTHKETNLKNTDTKRITLEGLRKKLVQLDLLQNKHIPTEYEFGSIKQRKALLAGLIDSDGHLTKKGSYELCCQEVVIKKAYYIAKSLGYRATIGHKIIKGKKLDIRLTIRSKDFSDLPIRCEYKRSSKVSNITNLSPFKVEKSEEKNFVGITVDSLNNTLLLKDYSEVSNCGKFNNLMECYNAAVECQMDGSRKFGSMVFLGTGGDFDGGGTLAAYDMFYSPDKYNILFANDVWENKGKIGLFIPAYLGLNQYKVDIDNNTKIEEAHAFLEKEREKIRSHKGSSAKLNNELQYRPLKPSEVFLASTGNIFPIAELKDRLAELETNEHYSLLEKKVKLVYDPKQKYGVNYKIDVKDELTAINSFPWTDEKSREGCTVIYEFPLTDNDGVIPQDLYIIGHDPYATDNSSGESLGVIYVIKTKQEWQTHGHDEIVATFAGRPYEGRHIVNETLLKLSMFYGNAKVYFENVRGNVKEFFEKMKKLHLLAKRPKTVFNKKASFMGGAITEYGYPMTSRTMKMDGLLYIRDWLVEERMSNSDENTVRNLNRIWDKALLQELIAFDMDGNYDRVMAFMGCIVGLNEMHNQYENKFKEASKNDKWNYDLSFLTEDKKINRQTIQTMGIDFNDFNL